MQVAPKYLIHLRCLVSWATGPTEATLEVFQIHLQPWLFETALRFQVY